VRGMFSNGIPVQSVKLKMQSGGMFSNGIPVQSVKIKMQSGGYV
jgi:hypothetical protein